MYNDDWSLGVNARVFPQVEKQRADLSRELDDLTDKLEEAGGATASQVQKTLVMIVYSHVKGVFEQIVKVNQIELHMFCNCMLQIDSPIQFIRLFV